MFKYCLQSPALYMGSHPFWPPKLRRNSFTDAETHLGSVEGEKEYSALASRRRGVSPKGFLWLFSCFWWELLWKWPRDQNMQRLLLIAMQNPTPRTFTPAALGHVFVPAPLSLSDASYVTLVLLSQTEKWATRLESPWLESVTTWRLPVITWICFLQEINCCPQLQKSVVKKW